MTDMMTDETVTRATLSAAVADQLGVARHEAATIVESVFDLIMDSLAQGESVKLSSFGAFSVRDKAARVGRNPKTGEEVPITPRRVLVFRASQILKDLVGGGERAAAANGDAGRKSA